MATLRRAGVAGLVSALALTLVSCGGDEKPEAPEPDVQRSPDAPTTPSPSTPSPTSFESDRHSYSIKLPPGWTVSEFGGTWTSFEQFTPGAEVPGEDVASSPDGQGFLVANSITIPEGMSPADWSAELLRLTRSGRGPGCEEAIDKDVLAGERATLVEHRCEGTNVIGRSLTHAGRGYYFTIGFPADDSAAQATLERIVASVRFLER